MCRESKDALISKLVAEATSGNRATVSLSQALEFRRDQYGLSKKEFAKVLGLQASHYSEVVNGKRALPIAATKRAFAVGVPAEALLQPTKGGAA